MDDYIDDKMYTSMLFCKNTSVMHGHETSVSGFAIFSAINFIINFNWQVSAKVHGQKTPAQLVFCIFFLAGKSVLAIPLLM